MDEKATKDDFLFRVTVPLGFDGRRMEVGNRLTMENGLDGIGDIDDLRKGKLERVSGKLGATGKLGSMWTKNRIVVSVPKQEGLA